MESETVRKSKVYRWAEKQQVVTILNYRNTRSQMFLLLHLALSWICSCEETYRKIPKRVSRYRKIIFCVREMTYQSKRLPTLKQMLEGLSPVRMNSFITFLRDCVAKPHIENC
jgi:hypothetical protein